MKRKIVTVLFGLICLFCFVNATRKTLPNCDAPLVGGHTGAPGETACNGCHAGALNSGSATFTFDLGTTTYSPNQTYTGSVRIRQSGMAKFGYSSLALKNSDNTSIGNFNVINAIRTRTYTDGPRKYVSHTPCGADSANSNSWTFQWTAPPSNVGNITLYIGFLAADHSHSTSGDFSYTQNILLTPQITNGIEALINEKSFNIFPNPARDCLNVNYNASDKNNPVRIKISDLQNKIIYECDITGSNIKIKTADWVKGLYTITLIQNNKSVYKKLIIE